jgi:hypothetical protein
MHLINLKLDTKHPLRYREGTTGYEKTGSPLSKVRYFLRLVDRKAEILRNQSRNS